MPAPTAETSSMVVPPADAFVPVSISGFLAARLSDGTYVKLPSYSIGVATRYPVDEDGSLVADMTQAGVADFLRGYNKAHDTSFRCPLLLEDEAIRDQLGENHTMFDENFEKNGMPWRRGYLADFTRQHAALRPLEGVDGQTLVHREFGWRMPYGDVIVGPVTIAPGGMVPRPSRTRLEKKIGAKGLKRLGELRGREITEQGEEIVDVRNVFGDPQYTLDHAAEDESGLVPHSHHVYTPSQGAGETVGVRDAYWLHPGVRGCFSVALDVDSSLSAPNGSFPLVRGAGAEAEISRSGIRITFSL